MTACHEPGSCPRRDAARRGPGARDTVSQAAGRRLRGRPLPCGTAPQQALPRGGGLSLRSPGMTGGERAPLDSPAASLDAALADLTSRLRSAFDPPPNAAVTLGAAEVRRLVEGPLPDVGMPLESVLGALVERVTPGLAGTTGGRYLGYVTGGVLPSAAIAHAWAGAVDQNPGLWALGPAATELEDVVLGWLADLLGLPDGSGVMTSGGAGANLVCLAVAREAAARGIGVDVGRDGIGALPRYAVYGSSEMHFTNTKALRVLGLGTGCLRTIAVDERYRMRVDELDRAIAADVAAGILPIAVVAAAGSPNTGASDPIVAISEVCLRHGVWLHVDGAFGAFFRLCPRTAPLVDGIERADSVTVDGHKWLNLPTGTGFAFLRDEALHRAAFTGSAAYLTRPEGAGADLHERGLEASRPWRSASAWAALAHLGREGVATLVTRCCNLAQGLGQAVDADPCLDLVAPVASCVVCFRYRPPGMPEGDELDRLNREIQALLTAGGEILATGGTLPSGFCLRPAIVSWRTTEDDLAFLASEVRRLGDELTGRPGEL